RGRVWRVATAPLGKRWTTSRRSAFPSNRPRMPRPLSAPRSNARNFLVAVMGEDSLRLSSSAQRSRGPPAEPGTQRLDAFPGNPVIRQPQPYARVEMRRLRQGPRPGVADAVAAQVKLTQTAQPRPAGEDPRPPRGDVVADQAEDFQMPEVRRVRQRPEPLGAK